MTGFGTENYRVYIYPCLLSAGDIYSTSSLAISGFVIYKFRLKKWIIMFPIYVRALSAGTLQQWKLYTSVYRRRGPCWEQSLSRSSHFPSLVTPDSLRIQKYNPYTWIWLRTRSSTLGRQRESSAKALQRQWQASQRWLLLEYESQFSKTKYRTFDNICVVCVKNTTHFNPSQNE